VGKRQALQSCMYFAASINTGLTHCLSEVTYVTGSQFCQVPPMPTAVTWPLSALLTSGSASAFLIGCRVSKIHFGSPARVKTLYKVGHGLRTWTSVEMFCYALSFRVWHLQTLYKITMEGHKIMLQLDPESCWVLDLKSTCHNLFRELYYPRETCDGWETVYCYKSTDISLFFRDYHIKLYLLGGRSS